MKPRSYCQSQGTTIKPQSCSQATGFLHQTSIMVPGHRFQNQTNVKFPGHGFQYQASVMFPVHRVPQSNLSHVASPQVSAIKPQSSSSHRVPESTSVISRPQGTTSNLSHIPGHRSNQTSVPGTVPPQSSYSQEQVSRIKPHHVPRPQGFRSAVISRPGFTSNLSHVPMPQGSHQTSISSHRVPHQLIFARPRFPSSLSHVPSRGSTIKPQSCCQATGFQHQTSVMFPGNRFPESNQCHVPRTRGSSITPLVMFPVNHGYTIKPQSCCQSTGFCDQTTFKFPGNRVPE